MEHLFDLPTKSLNADIFKAATGFDLYQRGNDLVISGDCTKAQAEAALAAHNPPAPTEATVADKLASVGLSIANLKAALGL
jgi:hypothetical protein